MTGAEIIEAIAAIRADVRIGRGTCSVIDECYDDADLAALFRQREVTDVRSAINMARQTHDIYHDVMDDRYEDARNSAF